jgi:23S rRNA pseudouridine1911/1915/1917 synthase
MSANEKIFVYQGEEKRIDKVLSEVLGASTGSRTQIAGWINEGAVSVDDVVVSKPSQKVSHGSHVVVCIPEKEPTNMIPYEFPLSILYEDEHLLVLDKPCGISMHPGAGNRSQTIANAVVHHVGSTQTLVGQVDRPGIVHRLDKDTTGVVVVAKSNVVHAQLAKQFAERSIERQYTALVFTTPRAKRVVQAQDSGEVVGAIGRHPLKRKLMAIVSDGKPAVTHWIVQERFSYGCLLKCRLETGRTHQIRVHMQSIRCPVIGDRVYGDFTNLPHQLGAAAERFGRQALHAASLVFTHPITGDRLHFDSPLPPDFQELLNLFRNSS